MNSRGIITLVFDDGYQKVFSDILPLLDNHKIPAVFAITLQIDQLVQETSQNFTNWQQWQQVAATSSHEIAAHSLTHTDLTKLDKTSLQQQLLQPATTLGASTLVYPGGAFNNQVISVAKKNYQAARTLKRGFNSLNPADPYTLKTFNYTRHNFSPGKANFRALYAWLTNSWLIETYHLVDESTPITHSVKLSDFKRHINFISRLPISFKTIRQVIS